MISNRMRKFQFEAIKSNFCRCFVHVVIFRTGMVDWMCAAWKSNTFVIPKRMPSIQIRRAHKNWSNRTTPNISYVMMCVTDDGIGCQKFSIIPNHFSLFFFFFKENWLVICTRYCISCRILFERSSPMKAFFLVLLIVRLVAVGLRRNGK